MKKTLLSLFLLVGMCSNIYATEKGKLIPLNFNDNEIAQMLSNLPPAELNEMLEFLSTTHTPPKLQASSSKPNISDPIYLNDGKAAYRIDTKSNGDCGYTALGITRKALADTLLEMLGDSTTKEFVEIHIAAQMFSSGGMNSKFSEMLKNVKGDQITWYISDFIGLSPKDFDKKWNAGKYGFLNYMDLSETDADNRSGLGHLLATVLQKKINIISPFGTEVSFEPAAIHCPFTLKSTSPRNYNNELWLIHSDAKTHYEAARVED
ncbi:MAG: hypothetical protein LBT70_02270 [Holosporaceae bacterium]|jgi:hypothetical protein|nr:hypothetical protein [Holosporaceae bacterium]